MLQGFVALFDLRCLGLGHGFGLRFPKDVASFFDKFVEELEVQLVSEYFFWNLLFLLFLILFLFLRNLLFLFLRYLLYLFLKYFLFLFLFILLFFNFFFF